MADVWALMLDVEPGRDRIAHGEARAGTRAVVWLYLRDAAEHELATAVADACDTWGVACLKVCETRRVTDGDVPAVAREMFDAVGVSFGDFHSYPADA